MILKKEARLKKMLTLAYTQGLQFQQRSCYEHGQKM